MKLAYPLAISAVVKAIEFIGLTGIKYALFELAGTLGNELGNMLVLDERSNPFKDVGLMIVALTV